MSAGADWWKRRAERCDWQRAAWSARVRGRQRERCMCQAVGGANLNQHYLISIKSGKTLFFSNFYIAWRFFSPHIFAFFILTLFGALFHPFEFFFVQILGVFSFNKQS